MTEKTEKNIRYVQDLINKSTWSQYKIADNSGVDRRFISDLMTGKLGTEKAIYRKEKTINKYLDTLKSFFKPYVQEIKKLEKIYDKESHRLVEIVDNRSEYKGDPNGNPLYKAEEEIFINKKVLIYDIEKSAPLWRGYERETAVCYEHSHLLSVAFMEIEITPTNCLLDDYIKKECYTLEDFGYSEHELISKIYERFNECDIIIGYNNKSYDDRKVTADFMRHKFPAPFPYISYDLYRAIRNKASFEGGNGLDNISRQILAKEKTAEKVGQLELKCYVQHNQEAWKKLKEYNLQDVDLTWGLLKESLSYIGVTYNLSNLTKNRKVCPKCGHYNEFIDAGEHASKIGTYSQVKCIKCNSYVSGRYQNTVVKKNDIFIDTRPILRSHD